MLLQNARLEVLEGSWRARSMLSDGDDDRIRLSPWQWVAQMESVDGIEEIKKPTGQDLRGGGVIYGYNCQELWQ